LTGYVFTVGGCAVSWRACLHPTVAFSTTEAEYVAACDASKEVVLFKGLYAEFCGVCCSLLKGLYVESCITLFCDS
jgi:hypothetical protein